MNDSEIATFIWGVADLIRDTFERRERQDAVLTPPVLRHLDSAA